MKKPAKLFFFVLLPALLLAGGLYYGVRVYKHKDVSASKTGGSKDPDRTYRVTRGDMTLGLRLNGTIVANKKHKLGLEANFPTQILMTHVAMAEIPKYEKLLFFTDAAVIPVPTEAQRRQQIHYVNYICHALGIEEPRISLIHCAEKVSAKTFPYTVDYLEIIAEAQTGKFGRCIIDGPLDLKTSLDSVSLREKGIHSVIDGQADALIFPDIVAGNVFYKTITLFGYAKTAGVLQGTQCCCVLPSRADSPDSKYYSLALAAI